MLLAGGFALAQSNTASYITDINGRRVEVSSAASTDGERKELSQSINGRQVPLEQTETRVLSKGPNQTITETITRKFDRTGQVISTDRTVQDEQKHGNASTIRATIYRSDINGRLQEDERRVIDTQTQGSTTTADVVISRAGAAGSFEPVEKRTVVTSGDANSTHENQFIYRPSQSGQFVEAQRMVKDQQKTGNTVIENTAAYETDYTGAMQLTSQTMSTTTKVNDTSEVTETNVYERASLGRPRVEGTGPRIDEQRIIQRAKRPNGSVIETIAVRRPTLADPTHLGEPSKISETVCTGKCDSPAASASATQPQPGARP
jgi:hypothetical protein